MRTLPGIPDHAFRERLGVAAFTPTSDFDPAGARSGMGFTRHNIVRDQGATSLEWRSYAKAAGYLAPWLLIGGILVGSFACRGVVDHTDYQARGPSAQRMASK